MRRRALLAACVVLSVAAGPAPPRVTVRVLAFSDYHSHAVPFRSEGQPGRGGIARAVGFLKRARAEGPVLILGGGDMLNKGVPAWSDEFGCVEWPWLDGLVDAMALGNHDLDYGSEAFAACREATRVPVLAANLVDTGGRPYLSAGGKPYLVREVGGVRIGAFAVAGPDVQRLILPANRPPHTRWLDALETARAVVKTLRDTEKVQAVLFFGHQAREDDEAMARAVPGIDVVLGTHSHHKGGLTTLPGTSTRYIAPYQYLAYVSDLRLSFEGGRLAGVEGGLVPMDGRQPEDAEVAARVGELQARLRARRPERFAVVGRAARELTDAGISERPAPIGAWAAEVLRARAGAHVFFSTASSFRGGLPRGPFTREEFLSAIPYSNRIALTRLRGAQLREWLELSVSRRGSDLFSQLAGARYTLREGRLAAVEVLKDAAAPGRGFAPLDDAAVYLVGTTDYQASFVDGYRQIFAAGQGSHVTSMDVHDTLLDALKRGTAR